MKYRTIIILLITCITITFIPSQASYIEDKPISDYYYWGSLDTITIHNCTASYNYSLTFGTNLKESERIQYNWTAIHGSYIIEFKQNNEPVNDSGHVVAQLKISLYENNVLKDITYRTLMLYDYQWDMGLLVTLSVTVLTVLIIASLVLAIVKYYVMK